MDDILLAAAANLARRGFAVETIETAEEARAWLMEQIPDGASIGCGGSVTVRELGICEAKKAAGSPIYWHWMPDGTDNRTIFLHALDADFYLSSVNALTVGGQIVNIDATGNRLGALAWGPKKVILIVGKNKLVEGGVPQAIARIKAEACPKNAVRLQRDTACAKLGRCNMAECANPMCRVTEVLEMPPHGHEITVLLVNENMGY